MLGSGCYMGVPPRKLTYPTFGKRKIIFKIAWKSGEYVSFREFYQLKNWMLKRWSSDPEGPLLLFKVLGVMGGRLCGYHGFAEKERSQWKKQFAIGPSFWTRLLWRHKCGSIFCFVNTAAMYKENHLRTIVMEPVVSGSIHHFSRLKIGWLELMKYKFLEGYLLIKIWQLVSVPTTWKF